MVLDKDKRADYNQELYRRWRDARSDWDTAARHCLLYPSPRQRDQRGYRMASSD